MKTSVYCGIVLVASIGFLAGCSQLKNDQPPTAPSLSVHGDGWTDPTSTNFHGITIQQLNWNMTTCKSCHGGNYAGGTAQKSCLTCHTQTNGPEACNTCHGTFSAPVSNNVLWAPPRAVNGDTATTSRGVGAHQGHLQATIGKVLKCQECHTVPSQVYALGHINSPSPAIVAMNDTLANLVSGSGSLIPHPSYSASQLQCSNTYCHGNWQVQKATAPANRQYIYTDSLIVGANYSPKWTGGVNEAACGSCHGLPPKGHLGYGTNDLPLSSCGNSGCHTGVVDATGKILDPTKHINGKIDYESTERNF
jgi:predicted CxxxxCH...CXXCH cytochrome family protein